MFTAIGLSQNVGEAEDLAATQYGDTPIDSGTSIHSRRKGRPRTADQTFMLTTAAVKDAESQSGKACVLLGMPLRAGVNCKPRQDD